LFDVEVISLLYLGIPRDAMMLRAPETEALDEGTVPLDSTALQRSLLGHIAREVEWGSPNATESKPCGSRGKTTQTN
jgi:hypothetical protein